MKSIYLFITILTMSLSSAAQLQVIASAGGEAQNSIGSVSWTLGEAVVSIANAGGTQITQGFQQGNIQVSTTIDKSKYFGIEINVYPNPVKNHLTIQTQKQSGKLKFRLYDVSGQLLENGPVATSPFDVNLSDYPSGNYILQILEESNMLKSFKIVKQK